MTISKLDYFLEIAEITTKRSKDPSSKVGAIIVNEDSQIVGTGYNGFVAKCDESLMSLDRPMKYHLTIHAEMNALLLAMSHQKNLRNSTLYCTHAPCENCLKHILQAGIRKIFYISAEITVNRGTEDQKEAILRLIKATQAEVINKDGRKYEDELFSKNSITIKKLDKNTPK